jgi:O-antigen/teichoic acid export membrane protein
MFAVETVAVRRRSVEQLTLAPNWRKIHSDLLIAFSTHFFLKLVGYLVLAIMSRHLAIGEMGEFFVAATLGTFFVQLTELGTNTYLMREVTRRPEQALQRCAEVVSLRLCLGGAYFILFIGFVVLFKPDLLMTAMLTSLSMLLEQFYLSFASLFFGLKRIAYNGFAAVSSKVLLVGAVITAVLLHGHLQSILLCFVLSNAVMVGLAIWLVQTNIGKIVLIWDTHVFIRLLQASLPFFVSGLLVIAHFNIDILMLGLIESYLVVATYGAGFKLLEVFRFLIRPVVLIFLPLCTGMVTRQQWQGVEALFKKMLLVTGALGGGMALAVVLAADRIIVVVFGAQYGEAAAVLKILFLSVPVLYMATTSMLVANAMQLEGKVARIMLICVAIHAVLCGSGILVWGVRGAAWATVIAEVIIAAWLTSLSFQELRMSRTS